MGGTDEIVAEALRRLYRHQARARDRGADALVLDPLKRIGNGDARDCRRMIGKS